MEIGLSFDDVELVPRRPTIDPKNITLTTEFARGIQIAIPLVSAAMRTVTEWRLAKSLAQRGGIGVIHRNMTPEEQGAHVAHVRHEALVIQDPYTLLPTASLRDARTLMERQRVAGIPIIDSEHHLLGLLTNRDLEMLEDSEWDQPVTTRMTPYQRLITGPADISIPDAMALLKENRLEKLPLVDEKRSLKGLVTARDIRHGNFPYAAKDKDGRLVVFAAVGMEDLNERLPHLGLANGFVIDLADGFDPRVPGAIAKMKNLYPDKRVVAGNVISKEGAKFLIEAGADAVKVGMGVGSICITSEATGVGMPQISAIRECADICKASGVPLCADGGIRYGGDIAKAIAAGADTVMIGNLFAGTDESPGERIMFGGTVYKPYEGEGSLSARLHRRSLSHDRYPEDETFVPEGIESRVPIRGSVDQVVQQLLAQLRKSMVYAGAATIGELKQQELVQLTAAAQKQMGIHDVAT